MLSQAEEYANWLSLLSFWWVGRLMRRGFQGTLNQPHDLFDLPCGLHADELALRYGPLYSITNINKILHDLFISISTRVNVT